MLMGIDHLQRRTFVGHAADRSAGAVVMEPGRRDGGCCGRGHGARVVGRYARPQSMWMRRPRERRVRMRHLVQPVTGGPGEFGGCPFRRPVPQYSVDTTHRRCSTVRAHTCEHMSRIYNLSTSNIFMRPLIILSPFLCLHSTKNKKKPPKLSKNDCENIYFY